MSQFHISLVDADRGYLQEHVTAISKAPDLSLVGAGIGLFEALGSIHQRPPIDVLVINASQPGMKQLASWTVVHALLPEAAVVAMLHGLDDSGLLTAVAAGARGLYRLGTPGTSLVRCVRRVSQGIVDYDERLLSRLKPLLVQPDMVLRGPPREGRDPGGRKARGRTRPLTGRLTPRESQVLEMLGKGLSNRAIASRLFVSEKTVRNSVSRLMSKLGVANRTQAALWIRGYSHDAEPTG